MIVFELLELNNYDALGESDLTSPLLIQLIERLERVAKRLVLYFLRCVDLRSSIETILDTYREGFQTLRLIAESHMETSIEEEWREFGVEWCKIFQTLSWLFFAPDMISIQRSVKKSIKQVWDAYFAFGNNFGVQWLNQRMESLNPQGEGLARAYSETIEKVLTTHQHFGLYRLTQKYADPQLWLEELGDTFKTYKSVLDTVQKSNDFELSMIVVLEQAFRRFYERVVGACVMTVSFH